MYAVFSQWLSVFFSTKFFSNHAILNFIFSCKNVIGSAEAISFQIRHAFTGDFLDNARSSLISLHKAEILSVR